MSKTLGVRSHPQHRWAHHVHDTLHESTEHEGKKNTVVVPKGQARKERKESQ